MNRKLLFLLTVVFVALPIKNILSCSCGGWLPFIEAHKNGSVVAIVEVEKYLTFREDEVPLSMEVNVTGLISGSEAKGKITVWGDRGWDCLTNLDRFPVGSKWLFAPKRIDDPVAWDFEQASEGDYAIGGCGAYFLEVVEDSVEGYIFQSSDGSHVEQTYKLDKLIDLVKSGVTSLGSDQNNVTKFSLDQNYPNPFNPETIISFRIPSELADKSVKLTIYNLMGEEVDVLLNKKLPAGNHKTKWNGTNSRNTLVNSGIYFYKLQIENNYRLGKMSLVK